MPNIYKKKNPRTQYVRQLILYSVMLILCIIAKLWPVMFIFAALIGFSGFMLYRNKDKESYSLADYISKYDWTDVVFQVQKGEGVNSDDIYEAAMHQLDELEL